MNTARLIVPAALAAASILLLTTAHAAPKPSPKSVPKPDPKVVGTWYIPDDTGAITSQMSFVFRADGTETMSNTGGEAAFIAKGLYTTKSGTLTMKFTSATDNGQPASSPPPRAMKYTVTPTTLTLDDGTPEGHFVLKHTKN